MAKYQHNPRGAGDPEAAGVVRLGHASILGSPPAPAATTALAAASPRPVEQLRGLALRVGSLPALLKLSDAESDASAVLASAKAATSVALNSAALKGQAEPVEIESVICGQQH